MCVPLPPPTPPHVTVIKGSLSLSLSALEPLVECSNSHAPNVQTKLEKQTEELRQWELRLKSAERKMAKMKSREDQLEVGDLSSPATHCHLSLSPNPAHPPSPSHLAFRQLQTNPSLPRTLGGGDGEDRVRWCVSV
jgi:hypothetical protein